MAIRIWCKVWMWMHQLGTGIVILYDATFLSRERVPGRSSTGTFLNGNFSKKRRWVKGSLNSAFKFMLTLTKKNSGRLFGSFLSLHSQQWVVYKLGKNPNKHNNILSNASKMKRTVHLSWSNSHTKDLSLIILFPPFSPPVTFIDSVIVCVLY